MMINYSNGFRIDTKSDQICSIESKKKQSDFMIFSLRLCINKIILLIILKSQIPTLNNYMFYLVSFIMPVSISLSLCVSLFGAIIIVICICISCYLWNTLIRRVLNKIKKVFNIMLMPSMKMPRTVCGLFALKQIIRKKNPQDMRRRFLVQL